MKGSETKTLALRDGGRETATATATATDNTVGVPKPSTTHGTWAAVALPPSP